ncbi:MAG TPA: phasin family protein [Xanthobacteraceae bacterium]|nr:phasin family protein [Xanthobacteraceae bacterium]
MAMRARESHRAESETPQGAVLGMQEELFKTFEHSSQEWFARMRTEMDLWSELATKLATTKSAPEAFEAYRDCATQRMQMAMEDGRRIMEDCQRITQSLSNGLQKGRSDLAR